MPQIYDQREAELKAQAERAQYANAAQAPAYPDAVQAGCLGDANVVEKQREPLIFALRSRQHSTERDYQRTQRAIEILERHPEFEELRELIRIVGF